MAVDEGKQVLKTWGKEQYVCNGLDYCAKFLYVSRHHVCSLHRHPIKTETFHVTNGSGVIVVASEIYKVSSGDTIHVPRGTWHCFATATGMTLLEVSTHHEDSDVERQSESHQLSPETDPAVWEALYR